MKEMRRTLTLVEVESNTDGREGPMFDVYRNARGNSMEQVLEKADDEGVFRNLAEEYFGIVERMHYEPREEEFPRSNRFSLTFQEFLDAGRPREILETKTYEAVKE